MVEELSASDAVVEASPAIVPSTRQRLVRQAIDDWKRQLIDLGGRNNLLYFRDLKVGTLDLSISPGTDVLERLFAGRNVRLSEVFVSAESRKDAARRARTLRAKAIENDEERGLHTLHLARGFSTWTSDRSSSTPNAPVLLYRLEMRATGLAADDFELQITGDPELNPTLLHLLSTDFNVRVDGESLVEHLLANSSDGQDVQRLIDELQEQCGQVPNFRVIDRLVVGNFSYAKLPMVRDLERSQEQIEQHDLLAAVAGDLEARRALRDRQSAAAETGIIAVPPPRDEYLVLDADSSQSYAIAAAVAGANLVVIGPPGTGKSQTIANLIATLIARGRSVLFVAEKRAAIEAVATRLQRRGLGDLILDLHDGASNRRRIAEELNRALTATGKALAPDVAKLHLQLERRRGQLEAYADQLHEPSTPWGVTPFEAQSRLLGISAQARSEHRLRGKTLESLTPDSLARGEADAQRFVELGGSALLRGEGVWARTYAARRAANATQVERIQDVLHDLYQDRLPRLIKVLEEVASESGLEVPATLHEATEIVRLLGDVDEVSRALTSDVFALDLPAVLRGMAPAMSFGPLRLAASVFNGEFRQARRALRDCAGRTDLSDNELYRLTALAVDTRSRWDAISIADRPPAPVGQLADATEACDGTTRALADLVEAAELQAGAGTPLVELGVTLAALDRDRTVLARLPELHRSEDSVRALQIGPILDEAVGRDLSADLTAQAIEHVWLASILDRLHVERPALASFDPMAQDTAVNEFSRADRAHLEIAADRVRRAWAERVVDARNAFGEEAALVAKQASLRRRHLPIRELFDQAEHVLTAVKPCWVMSPLVVAQVLPARPCFDVVVFDEASQIPPSDAACSLLRGRQAIVAGDPHQLPPTSFFSSNTDDNDEAADDVFRDEDEQLESGLAASLTKDIESILDVMRSLLPGGQRVLNWHYRSKDERLITFSNAQEALYDWSLTTFPGALAGECIQQVLVPFRPGAARVTASVPDEVERVVDLVVEHARERPDESLGVIALGSTHANQISEALRIASAEHPELALLMDEDREEPLFIKNLERVQGDERDAIILTVGYGKTIDGRMRYNFGPLNQEGGHRRLNVAITRARRRMTVVSSFSGGEMDPERLHSIGARMLRDYLLYGESGGANLGVRARPKPALNPFERDVEEQLAAHGIRLVPQYGASGYWIDFAAMHPDRPSEPVMAIEADGASYHSAPSARDRDRLRQEHLERLGWRFHRIWSTDWFRSREQEVERAVEAYESAIGGTSGVAQPAMTSTSTEVEPDWLPTAPRAATSASRIGGSPVRPGRAITDYGDRQLREVVRWVKSDGRLYSDDELVGEAMQALGFQKRGSRIVDALKKAIAAER